MSYAAIWMSTVGGRSRSLVSIFTEALDYFRPPVTLVDDDGLTLGGGAHPDDGVVGDLALVKGEVW